jgi:16S rRNA processing protein RimM
LVFKFRGVDSIDAAELLYGSEVRIPAAERVALEDGEFFLDDLIGCEVIDRRTGARLGQVSGLDESGGAGNLVVGDLLIPFARAICVEINPKSAHAVELPGGIEGNQSAVIFHVLTIFPEFSRDRSRTAWSTRPGRGAAGHPHSRPGTDHRPASHGGRPPGRGAEAW